jgi:arginyl-tRNA--protein-N-Asp/Glu arginylyltransferase
MTLDYLHWDEQTLTDFSPENITTMYDRGYVCTRPEEGHMEQTRSVRVNLSKFELTSENRRILRKTEPLTLTHYSLPFSHYSWHIGKLGKDFYETKFGDGTFSANKIKELLTGERRDFTTLLVYTTTGTPIGYAICVETDTILHYSYPFYALNTDKNLGMGMMVRALVYAQEQGKTYCYLGSAQRPNDTYKLQFHGIEWFDGTAWQTDIEQLKTIL